MAITASVTKGFTYDTGVELSPANLNSLGTPTVTVATPISIANGGTNANSASNARSNLGLGTMAVQNEGSVEITGGEIEDTVIRLKVYNVAGVPSASTAGKLIWVTDGNSGQPTVAVSDGSNWKVIAFGATIST
tara:strand:- start:147 stop:548 length:402 start_codon:yes stop_codon:yes gene_type:complete